MPHTRLDFIDGQVRSYAPDINHDTVDQVSHVANLPFVTMPMALMPDAHHGYGTPVGSVVPTEGAIVPYMVGYDIGCGCSARETELTSDDLPDSLDGLHSQIEATVPAGMGQGHQRAQTAFRALLDGRVELPADQEGRAAGQLGSLGSGNHFIEVCLDERDRVWVILHSGSRGVGYWIADQFYKRALQEMIDGDVHLTNRELAYFVEGTDSFDEYTRAMLWAQDYAMANRQEMMSTVITEFEKFLGRPIRIDTQVNVHHNYANRETHFGKDVWITRKGAVRSQAGELGVIPGSMATGSYIVEGLGNPESYESSSHGAGRLMSRRAAKRELSADTLVDRMGGKAWNIGDAAALVDEHPDAYRSIEDVMDAQSDLVRPLHRLTAILNYKGT